MKLKFYYFLRHMKYAYKMKLNRECVVQYNHTAETFRGMVGIYILYVLVKKDNAIYVGMTYNIFKRMSAHKVKKDFDQVYFIIVNNRVNLPLFEKRAIKYFAPKLNKSHNSKKTVPIIR